MCGFHVSLLTRSIEWASEEAPRWIDAFASGVLDARVTAALAYVRAHCTSGRLPVAAVARAAHTSPWHLTRLVKRETGMALHAHIRAARRDVVRTLLESSTLSMKEVAARAGYRSGGELSRDFKRAFDMSPKEWRRRAARRRDRDAARSSMAPHDLHTDPHELHSL
jgi:transcriptional regulator GlxA family with amidase domain